MTSFAVFLVDELQMAGYGCYHWYCIIAGKKSQMGLFSLSCNFETLEVCVCDMSCSVMIGSNGFHMLSIPLHMLYLLGSPDLIVVANLVRDILSISILFSSYLNKSQFSLVLYATSCQSISIVWKTLKMHEGLHK